MLRQEGLVDIMQGKGTLKKHYTLPDVSDPFQGALPLCGGRRSGDNAGQLMAERASGADFEIWRRRWQDWKADVEPTPQG